MVEFRPCEWDTESVLPSNLKYMRQFYLAFPFCYALSDQLGWTHYRLLLKV